MSENAGDESAARGESGIDAGRDFVQRAIRLGSNPLVITSLSASVFVVGVTLNSLVFSLWGLPFSQLATAWDVLIGGLQVGSAAIVFGIFVLISLPLRRLRVNVLILIVASNAFGLAILSALIFGEIPRIFGIFLFIAFSGAAMNLVRFDHDGTHAQRAIVKTMIFLQFGSFILMTAAMQIYSSYKQGYAWSDRISADAPSCHFADVLWLGERAIVLRCRSEAVLVLRDPPSMVLRRGDGFGEIPNDIRERMKVIAGSPNSSIQRAGQGPLRAGVTEVRK